MVSEGNLSLGDLDSAQPYETPAISPKPQTLNSQALEVSKRCSSMDRLAVVVVLTLAVLVAEDVLVTDLV